MIIAILLSCFTIMASAVPVSRTVLPLLPLRGGAVQPVDATHQTPVAQTGPSVVPGPQFLPPLQHYTWAPIGGSPLIVPLQPSVQGAQAAGQAALPQQPLVFPPYGFFPIFSTPYMNQPVSPYGFPMTQEAPLRQTPTNQSPNPQLSLGERTTGPSVDAAQPAPQQQIFPFYGFIPLFPSPYMNQPLSPYGLPMNQEAPVTQTPANQPPNTQVSPAETPSGPVPSVDAAQPNLQQQYNPQNHKIVYMLQPPKNSPLGSLSSEELEMAAKLGQMGVYLHTMLTNSPAGGVQPANQAAGLSNRGQPEVLSTEGTSPPGAQQARRLHQRSGSAANGVPVGLKGPAQQGITDQTPAQSAHGNYI